MVDVALALQEQGHQVKIITSHFDPKHAFEPTYDGTLKVELARTLVPRSLGPLFHLTMAILQQLSLVTQVFVASLPRGTLEAHPELRRWLSSLETQPAPDVFIMDQLSVGIPLLKLLCGKRVMFYCHFPDKEVSASLAAQRAKQGTEIPRLIRAVYRAPLNLLEEITTGAVGVAPSAANAQPMRTW